MALRPTMTGHLVDCALLAFRTPAASVAHLLPQPLELVTWGEWAFWNVVACRILKMRPSGLPAWTGVTYHHVAYRLYVRAQTQSGPVEGLYFLRSDADARWLGTAGNWLSDFRFHYAPIHLDLQGDDLTLEVQAEGEGAAAFRATRRARAWDAAASCFPDEATACATLKYQPLGLAPAPRRRLHLAEVLRDEAAWHEDDLDLLDARFAFFDAHDQRDLHLERATLVVPLPYRWRLGRYAHLP